MSRKRLLVCCPVCGQEQAAELWESLNVAVNPALKHMLLQGQLNQVDCQYCGHRFEVLEDLVYHDISKRLMIAISNQIPAVEVGGCEDELGAYRLRVVRDKRAMWEKVRVFEDDLDDRLVEFFKIVALRALSGESVDRDAHLYYAGIYQNDHQTELVFEAQSGEGKAKVVPIPLEYYEWASQKVQDQLRTMNEQEAGSWHLIDSLSGARIAMLIQRSVLAQPS
ncbi:MAG: CpXC domain-containing protein [Solirubrobacterales bacterium]